MLQEKKLHVLKKISNSFNSLIPRKEVYWHSAEVFVIWDWSGSRCERETEIKFNKKKAGRRKDSGLDQKD